MISLKPSKKRIFGIALVIAVILSVGIWVIASVKSIDEGQRDAETARLEEALRRSAVACYAAEGVYPPTIEYLCERYGVQIDKDRYDVFYEIFAENLMPEITVIPKVRTEHSGGSGS